MSQFSPLTTKERVESEPVGGGKSYIQDLFNFKTVNFGSEVNNGLPKGEYINVPSGMNDFNVQQKDNFRVVANRGPFDGNTIHPLILRKVGSNWKDTALIFDDPDNGFATLATLTDGIGLLSYVGAGLSNVSRITQYLLMGFFLPQSSTLCNL